MKLTARFPRATVFVCIALHAYIVWNVYQWSTLTPRIIDMGECSL